MTARAIAAQISSLLTQLGQMPVQDRLPLLENVTNHAAELLRRAEDEDREKND